MDPHREIRCYTSIPKIILMLLLFGAPAFAAWWALKGDYHSGGLWAVLAIFGLISVIPLMWLILVAVFRQPILRITSDGMIYSAPIKPWSHTLVRWEEITRIWVAKQRLSSSPLYHLTYYYLIVEVDAPERFASSRLMRMNAAMYPALAKAAIMVAFSQFHFIASTHNQRERLLERIKTTFAPEIHERHVAVVKVERPM